MVEDPRLAQLLYPDDTAETRNSRIDFFLDLYLNTPDKHVGIFALCFIVFVVTDLFAVYFYLCSFSQFTLQITASTVTSAWKAIMSLFSNLAFCDYQVT